MNYQYNDGGRSEAGYKGDAGDCTVRAIAIALELPYKDVYDTLFDLNRKANPRESASPRDGNTAMDTVHAYLRDKGWTWVPTMKVGSGCKVHMKSSELPSGSIIARLSKHLVAVIDGVINDTYDCSREETRCVYGYFIKLG